MNKIKINKIAFSAIFVALVFVATFTVRIPISLGWGYVHLGDAVVLLAGMLLGPVFGAIAAGLGSSLADFASGYAVYALPTLIIKASAAFFVGFAFKTLKGESRKDNKKMFKMLYQSVSAYICVVFGYFITDLMLANLILVDTEGSTAYGYAAYGVIPNSIQICFGIIVAFLLYRLLKKPFNDIYQGS